MTNKQKILQDAYRPLASRLLAQSPPTAAVSETTREQLLAAASIRRHPAGAVLSRRGEPLNELLLVLEGSLEVSMRDADGRRAICWYLAPGQWMGLIPLLDGGPAIHDLQGHSASVLLHIPRAAFSQAVHADPQLPMACLALLCERSRRLYSQQAAEVLLPLQAKVAGLLLLLAERHGREADDGLQISLRLSQNELADMLGITRQSLNRELKALEKDGLIGIAYARITLRDPALLQQRAGSVEGSLRFN